MQLFISYYVRRGRKITPSGPRSDTFPPVVLLCARNESPILPQTLPTLLEQSLPIQVVAGDDGSTDDTRSILERFLGDGLHRVFSIPPESHALFPGKQAALAYLEQYVRPPYFGVVDADMWVPPSWAETLIGALEADPRIGAVSGPSLPRANGLWTGFQRIEWAATLYLILAQQMRGHSPPTAIGNSLWVRYQAWQSIGGWKNLPPTLVEDFHFMQAILKKGWHFVWVFTPEACAETRAEKTFRSWWHQRLRWRRAIQDIPLLAKFYWSVQVLVPWVVLISNWQSFTLWVLAEVLPLWRLKKVLQVRSVLRYLPLLLVYRYFQGALMIVLSVGRHRFYWRGRWYEG